MTGVILVGHGWNPTEQFVGTMTVREFRQHWRGLSCMDYEAKAIARALKVTVAWLMGD